MLSYVTGATQLTATADVGGETIATWPLKINWYRFFDSIQLAPTRQRLSLDRRATVVSTIEYEFYGVKAGVPGVVVSFKVSWVPSSQGSAELAAVSSAAPATALPFTKRATTNRDGRAVLLLDNPRRHTPGTYKVVASATSDDGRPVESNPVLVTWWGQPEGEHKHSGGYGCGERDQEHR